MTNLEIILSVSLLISLIANVYNSNKEKEKITSSNSEFDIDDIYRTYDIICEGISYKIKLVKGKSFPRNDDIYVNKIRCTSVFSSTFDGKYTSKKYLESQMAQAIEVYKEYLETKVDLSMLKSGEIKSKNILEKERIDRFYEQHNKINN